MDPETGRRRRSVDMARKSRIRPSPSHGCRQCPGQTPRNCGVSAARVHGPRFAEMRVVVDAVSSEPVSAAFPVKQGINREFSRNHPIIRPIGPSNTLVSIVFSVEFPKHRNREFFQRNREFNPWNRELSGWIREPSYSPLQLKIGSLQPPSFSDLRSRTGDDPMTGAVFRFSPNYVRSTSNIRRSRRGRELPRLTHNGLWRSMDLQPERYLRPLLRRAI